jgi:hypothetical protein
MYIIALLRNTVNDICNLSRVINAKFPGENREFLGLVGSEILAFAALI